MKVGIIGNGWVGKAMKELFPEAITYVRNYDKYFGQIRPEDHITDQKELINECDIVFIAVPTPNDEAVEYGEGKLDTSIVEECIEWCQADLLVIRSTVNPGDCDKWTQKYNKNIVFQPEYLGETPAHPLLDTKQTNFMILGGNGDNIRKLIDLYATVYNANVKIRQMSSYEAEVVKLSENRAIAYKVAQCQELYDVCEIAAKEGKLIDYYRIRDAVYSDDPRFNLWWSFVYPDKRGFNSKCIPKDVYAWCAWAESLGYEPKVTRALLEKNKEWIK